MAGLEVLVEQRRREGRPAPEEGNARDRQEFLGPAQSLLTFLDDAFRANLGESEPEALTGPPAAETADLRARQLATQVRLARRLPDYWQRFEAYRVEFAGRRLGATPPSRGGWLRRLFGS